MGEAADLSTTASSVGAEFGLVGAAAGPGSRRLAHAVYRQLKRPFFGRFMRPWRWPDAVPQADYERTVVVGRSGSALATLVRRTPSTAPRGVLVLAHPMGLAAKGFWLKYGHADALVARGWHVVAFDFNGFGESPSTDFDYPGDLIAVGRWARARFPELPVGVVAASFGAMRALEAAASEPALFDAVIAEGAAPTLPDFWSHYPAAQAMLRLSQVVYPPWEQGLRPERLLRSATSLPPLLLIHSRADKWTPPHFGDRIEAGARRAQGKVERLVLDSAEHTHAMRDARETYLSHVDAFLDKHIAREETR